MPTPRRRSEQINAGVARAVVGANIAAAVLVGAYVEICEPRRAGVAVGERLALNIAGTVLVTFALAAIATRHARGTFEAAWRWCDDARPPTADERDAVLGQPWRMTVQLFRYWVAAALIAGTAFAALDSVRLGITAFTAVALGGLTASGLTFLLIERTLRPLFVDALRGEPAVGGRLPGVRRRMLFAWGVGSGIPLLAIVATPALRHPNAEVPLSTVVVFLGTTALIAGCLATVTMSRSIGGPIEAVRRGMSRAQDGDLDAVVPVDDGGEVGMLEAGFNRMVTGLRERQRIHELFGQHVGEEVARRAVEHGIDLRGESRDATVLFVDLVGSTAMAEVTPAEAVVERLNHFFAVVVDAVEREGGWVNKFEGDAAMCVFGPPGVLGDHAARGLRAARRLSHDVGEIDTGIGVSAGRVVAGHVGTRRRYEYTLIGHAVNEAARLTEAAKRSPTRVLASAAAVCGAGAEAAEWTEVGLMELRGITDRVRVYSPRARP